MIPLDLLLALALLASPGDVAEPERFATVRPTLQALAVTWELLDPREAPWMPGRPADFACDLALLRRRYRELNGAPPLADAMRFPGRDLVNDLLAANRAYRQLLVERQTLWPGDWWGVREQIAEVDRLYEVWDLVRDSAQPYYYVSVRRQALRKLRDLVGEQAYHSGALPPHLPLWAMGRID